MERDVIIEIQEALNDLSNTDNRLIPVTLDGIYTRQTAKAVRVFQSLYGLEPTGEVDNATFEELRDQMRDKAPKNADPLFAFPHPSFVLKPDSTHPLAGFVQLMLSALSAIYSNIQAVSFSNVYDRATVDEIKQLQKMHRLEPNGNVDITTWNILARLYNHRFDTTKE